MATYIVQPGDTLWRIAQRFGVTPEAIARANNITDPNLIFAGQVITIPAPGIPPGPSAPQPTIPPVVPPGVRAYVVQPGETLAEIAARFGATVSTIAKANNIANPDLIYAGQVLYIPVTPAPPGPPVPPVPPTPPAPPRPPVPPTPPPVTVPPRPGNYATRLEGNILYSLYTNRNLYKTGERVRIVFFKTNISSEPVTLEYRTGQQYDIVVTRNSEEIWRWSKGKFFTLVITQTTLQPGESQVFREVWEQVNNEGRQVPPDHYIITAWNTATNVDVSVEIDIVRG